MPPRGYVRAFAWTLRIEDCRNHDLPQRLVVNAELAHYGSGADDPPPSLHGHYPASSLLQGGPPLDAASVLSLSWFNPLAAFPLATTPSFPRSLRSPLPGSAHLYAGCRPARKQAPSELVPRSSDYRGLDIVLAIFDTITFLEVI